MNSANVGLYDLKIGQWVTFSEEDPKIPGGSQKEFLLKGPFKVIARCDTIYVLCRCMLMGEEGQSIYYEPHLNQIDHKELPWMCRVQVISEKSEISKLDAKIKKFLEAKS